jgi:hypothetical protein
VSLAYRPVFAYFCSWGRTEAAPPDALEATAYPTLVR